MRHVDLTNRDRPRFPSVCCVARPPLGLLEPHVPELAVEFLAVGSMAALSIYLRQRGSPESKPVGAAHDSTGVGAEHLSGAGGLPQ